MSNIELAQTYSKVGAYLIPQGANNHHKLILHTRKKVEPKKPSLYVMYQAEGKPLYLSSLFPTEQENRFILETGGRYYSAILTDTEMRLNTLQSKVL